MMDVVFMNKTASKEKKYPTPIYPSQYEVVSRELEKKGLGSNPVSSQPSSTEKSQSNFVFPYEPGRESPIRHLIQSPQK
jgi:hypothetical protein